MRTDREGRAWRDGCSGWLKLHAVVAVSRQIGRKLSRG
jgi:hypothetical protein